MVSFRTISFGLVAIAASAQNPFQQLASKLSSADIQQAAAAAMDKGPAVGTCACLRDWVDHCRKTTKERWYYLNFTLCLTYTNGNVIYSEGVLSWNAATQSLMQVPATGDPAYYNDSRDGAGHPFKFNNQQPKAKVHIRANCIADVTRAVTHSVPLQCSGNLLYGFLPAQGEGYLISLAKREMLVPR